MDGVINCRSNDVKCLAVECRKGEEAYGACPGHTPDLNIEGVFNQNFSIVG